jgi:hypothetical protein
MPDETARIRSSVAETLAALVTIILAILALAHVAPEFLVAIATIVFGATLLLHGSATVAEYARMSAQAGTSSAVTTGNGGLSAVFLAGVAGVILGILALLRISTNELTAIAVVAFGAALILSSSSTFRLYLLRLSLSTAEQRTRHLASDMLAGDMLSSSAGILGLAGLAAIILGILALAGFVPVILILIALLTIGSVSVVNGVDIADTIVSAYWR